MSKLALISDVHGNLPALEAVLEELDKHVPDHWLCLGDVVGYGPFPSECIDLIRERNIPTVMGNHDAGVAGLLTIRHFKGPNKELISLTNELLNNDQLKWLEKLPYTLVNDDKSWLAVHANPLDPSKWEYVDSAIKARKMLGKIDQKLCFVGHTHIPGMVSDQIGVMEFKEGHKYLINPGSVGQSRDGDFRASCCIIDIEKWNVEMIRVTYPMEQVLTGLYKLGFSRAEAHQLLRY
jgi:predicted phosphodiesterase